MTTLLPILIVYILGGFITGIIYAYFDLENSPFVLPSAGLATAFWFLFLPIGAIIALVLTMFVWLPEVICKRKGIDL